MARICLPDLSGHERDRGKRVDSYAEGSDRLHWLLYRLVTPFAARPLHSEQHLVEQRNQAKRHERAKCETTDHALSLIHI